jgi:sugar/nucleoside kinase (ribokinase family)
MENKQYSVYGIENPLMDYIGYVDDAYIEKINVTKGITRLVPLSEAETLLSGLRGFLNIPGGSGANTLRGIAWLSKYSPIEPSVYGGAVGSDDVGQKYIGMMTGDYGLKTVISQKHKKTGVSIVLVTPDCERTMSTYLGACEDFTSGDIDNGVIAKSRIFHTTGYMWGGAASRDAMKNAVEYARSHGTKVSFDLADPFVVKNHRDDFLAWLPSHVDYLFGNRDEVSMLTGVEGTDERIAKKAGSLAAAVIVKVGAKGCIINNAGKLAAVPGNKVEAIDTVGAGDSFAAGFLYGICRNMDLQACATIANSLASEIVTVEGCNYFKLNQATILSRFR